MMKLRDIPQRLVRMFWPRISKKDIINGCYNAVLDRKPDHDGFILYIRNIELNGFEHTLRSLLSSSEYKSRLDQREPSFVAMNFAPPMTVEVIASEDELDMMWRHIGAVWTNLGNTDPFWSVITDPRLQTSSEDLKQAIKDDFYASGAVDVVYMDAFLARAGIAVADNLIAAEYGCGIGRTTAFLARRHAVVRAFDISGSHLAMAEKALSDSGIHNVEFIQVKARTDLSRLNGIDLFFSIIVLQHNPPSVIIDILDKAFAGLRSGGIAFFQVPSFSGNYAFSPMTYLAKELHSGQMEMHFVPQRLIYNVAEKHNMKLLETRQDHCIGQFHQWISNTYLMLKK